MLLYNTNIYICVMDGWQPIIKKGAWYDVTMAHSGRNAHLPLKLGTS